MPWNLYPAGIITIHNITSVVRSASICTVLLFCSNFIKFRRKKYINYIAVDEVEMSVAESAVTLIHFCQLCRYQTMRGVFALNPAHFPQRCYLHIRNSTLCQYMYLVLYFRLCVWAFQRPLVFQCHYKDHQKTYYSTVAKLTQRRAWKMCFLEEMNHCIPCFSIHVLFDFFPLFSF